MSNLGVLQDFPLVNPMLQHFSFESKPTHEKCHKL